MSSLSFEPSVRFSRGTSSYNDSSTFHTVASTSTKADLENPAFYLNAFNDKVDLMEAYSWDRSKIKRFMADVVRDPYAYGVSLHVAPELQRILMHISGIIDNNRTYSIKYLGNDPMFGDTIGPGRMHKSSSEYQLSLEIWVYDCVPYWCSFDLLGRFLSLMGPAPRNATISNFYLPLTAMYSQWCAAIAAKPPCIFSCLWVGRGRETGQFYLGASFAETPQPSPEIDLSEMVRRARFNLLNDDAVRATGFTFERRSFIKFEDPTRFGDCAETYPLIHMLKSHDLKNENVFGISLGGAQLSKTRYDPDEAWQRVIDACTNCQDLIRLWGGKVENFIHSAFNEYAATTTSLTSYTSASIENPDATMWDSGLQREVSNHPLERYPARGGESRTQQERRSRRDSESGLFGWVRSIWKRSGLSVEHD